MSSVTRQCNQCHKQCPIEQFYSQLNDKLLPSCDACRRSYMVEQKRLSDLKKKKR